MLSNTRRYRLLHDLAGPWSARDVDDVEAGDDTDRETDGIGTNLLVAVRHGDEAAFDTLCLTYAERLWRFAYGMVQSREAAQDIVQDVLLDLWTRRAEIAVDGTVAGYLFGAVRRRALFYLRNDQTAARLAATWTSDALPGASQTLEAADTRVERRDLQRQIATAVAALPEVRRQVLALRWDQQLSYEEIAEVMSISEDAARAHVSRGYRALRALLQQMGVEPPA